MRIVHPGLSSLESISSTAMKLYLTVLVIDCFMYSDEQARFENPIVSHHEASVAGISFRFTSAPSIDGFRRSFQPLYLTELLSEAQARELHEFRLLSGYYDDWEDEREGTTKVEEDDKVDVSTSMLKRLRFVVIIFKLI